MTKIRITGAGLSSYWYAGKIGEVFDAELANRTGDYRVKDCRDNSGTVGYVGGADCEVVTDKAVATDLENDLDFVERFIERRNLKSFDIRESAITDHFIAEAVKCWPAAIKRAIEAEDKLDRLTADLRILQDALNVRRV